MNTRILTAAILAVAVAAAHENEPLAAAVDTAGVRESGTALAPPMPTLPSGVVPASCETYKTSRNYGLLLPCYLNHPDNAIVANFIAYSPTSPHDQKWKDWPTSRKDDLAVAFGATVAWRHFALNYYPGPSPAPEAPVNIEADRVMQGVHGYTIFDEETIWRIYRGRIAMLLAAEIYSWVPWSFKSYLTATSSSAMTPLFSQRMAGRTHNGVLVGRGPVNNATPTNPITIYRFLTTNNLIGPTRQDTIERVLNWTRWHLSHMFGDYGTANSFYYWQYWGEPPLQRILAGTTAAIPDPTYELYTQQPYHWTKGCTGTTAFLIELLQAVNIPVDVASAGPHQTPYFRAERTMLSHGDDPYTDFAKSSRPVSSFFIHEQNFPLWFPAGSSSDLNVGRSVMEDNIYYPSRALVALHKLDVQEGRTHAASRVYDLYKKWYSVTALEQTGLWTRLAAIP